ISLMRPPWARWILTTGTSSRADLSSPRTLRQSRRGGNRSARRPAATPHRRPHHPMLAPVGRVPNPTPPSPPLGERPFPRHVQARKRVTGLEPATFSLEG